MREPATRREMVPDGFSFPEIPQFPFHVYLFCPVYLFPSGDNAASLGIHG